MYMYIDYTCTSILCAVYYMYIHYTCTSILCVVYYMYIHYTCTCNNRWYTNVRQSF